MRTYAQAKAKADNADSSFRGVCVCVCMTCDHMILIKRAGATFATTRNIFASSTAKQSHYINKENNNNSELYMSSLFLLLYIYQFFCLCASVCVREWATLTQVDSQMIIENIPVQLIWSQLAQSRRCRWLETAQSISSSNSGRAATAQLFAESERAQHRSCCTHTHK